MNAGVVALYALSGAFAAMAVRNYRRQRRRLAARRVAVLGVVWPWLRLASPERREQLLDELGERELDNLIAHLLDPEHDDTDPTPPHGIPRPRRRPRPAPNRRANRWD